LAENVAVMEKKILEKNVSLGTFENETFERLQKRPGGGNIKMGFREIHCKDGKCIALT
jgi:hypothetical protein